jgi:hypothetical protein
MLIMFPLLAASKLNGQATPHWSIAWVALSKLPVAHQNAPYVPNKAMHEARNGCKSQSSLLNVVPY